MYYVILTELRIKSHFLVYISYDLIRRERSEDILEIVKNLIDVKLTGIFVTAEADFQIEIEKKRKMPNKPLSRKTVVIMHLRELVKIDKEVIKKFRKKIIMDFLKKERQLKSVKPIFLVLYLKRWIMELDDIKHIFYGKITEDPLVSIRNFVGFENIFKAYQSHMEIVDSTGLMPKFIYPEKDGLFFMDNFDILNGIIAVKNERNSFLINPFAQNQISQDLFRVLRDYFNK